MIHKSINKNGIIRDLSVCVVEKFFGFNIIKIFNENRLK